MSKRQQIAIVCGAMERPRIMQTMEPLASRFELTVFAIYDDNLAGNLVSPFKIRLFEPVNDMPGYLRGLEDQLQGFDIIIGLEASTLASFQAMRAAKRFGVPFAVLVNEHRPFFHESYTNIRTIQQDIFRHADLFLATSQLAAQNLQREGVATDRIHRTPLLIDSRRFAKSEKSRTKFRNYFNIAPQDKVLLSQADLEVENKIGSVVEAFGIMRDRGFLQTKGWRVILAGNGSEAKNLKYQTYDLGLGHHIMFLHQDISPFAADLYNASDIIIEPKSDRRLNHEPAPMHLLEAMGCGCVPLTVAGGLGSEMAADLGQVATSSEGSALAAELQVLLTCPDLANERSIVAEQTAKNHVLGSDSSGVLEAIVTLTSMDWTAVGSVKGSPTDAIEKLLDHNQYAQAEQLARSKIGETTQDDPSLGRLLTQLGDALQSKGQYEEATEVYGKSLECNDRESRALRGLGYLAWQSHSNEEALTFFKKSLSIDNNDNQTMLGIGLVFKRVGLIDEAMFWIEKSLRHSSPSSAAILAFSQTCLECSSADLAIKRLEGVIELLGEKPALEITLGQLYVKVGRIELGSQLLQKAMPSGNVA